MEKKTDNTTVLISKGSLFLVNNIRDTLAKSGYNVIDSAHEVESLQRFLCLCMATYGAPNDGMSGYEWNKLFKTKYKKIIWLNPRYHGGLNSLGWMEAERTLAEIYDMFPLTLDGLKDGISKLMAPR